jgi:hypothetical protein
MSLQTPSVGDVEALRRHVAHHLYGRFAFASFVIWTTGTLVLFILFAAGNPRPVFPAMISMTTPLIPAFLIWIFYRPLVSWQVARRLRAESTASPISRTDHANRGSDSGRDGAAGS